MSERRLLAGFLAALALLPLGLGGNRYLLSVLMNCTGLALISLGVWITFCIGRINICQAGFALIGAYTVAIGAVTYGLPWWVTLPMASLVAGAAGVLIGMFVLKLRGIYFSMLTICLTEAMRLVFLNGGEFTHGSRGITGVPQPFASDSALPMYYLALALLAVGVVLSWRLRQSRIGHLFRALRLNEDLAESFGTNVWHYRLVAFGAACALGGLGGGYFALFTQSVYPQSFTVEHSIYYMLFCFLGGIEYVAGPIIGAFALTILFELLSGFQRYQSLLYGMLMIAAMLLMPNGLLSAWMHRRSRPGGRP